ncbi:DUF4304 domain-containing protein [Priestia megaterium]
MTAEKEKMIHSLKKNVIPVLRNCGFKGTFPHFYRKLESRLDLIMFQFSAWGGTLYVEVSKCAPDGHLDVSEELYIPNKVKVYHIDLEHRKRLGNETQEIFKFDKDNTEEVSICVRKTLKEAEEWWNSYPDWWI